MHVIIHPNAKTEKNCIFIFNNKQASKRRATRVGGGGKDAKKKEISRFLNLKGEGKETASETMSDDGNCIKGRWQAKAVAKACGQRLYAQSADRNLRDSVFLVFFSWRCRLNSMKESAKNACAKAGNIILNDHQVPRALFTTKKDEKTERNFYILTSLGKEKRFRRKAWEHENLSSNCNWCINRRRLGAPCGLSDTWSARPPRSIGLNNCFMQQTKPPFAAFNKLQVARSAVKLGNEIGAFDDESDMQLIFECSQLHEALRLFLFLSHADAH